MADLIRAQIRNLQEALRSMEKIERRPRAWLPPDRRRSSSCAFNDPFFLGLESAAAGPSSRTLVPDSPAKPKRRRANPKAKAADVPILGLDQLEPMQSCDVHGGQLSSSQELNMASGGMTFEADDDDGMEWPAPGPATIAAAAKAGVKAIKASLPAQVKQAERKQKSFLAASTSKARYAEERQEEEIRRAKEDQTRPAGSVESAEQRDERLRVVETLVRGPMDFGAPDSDVCWEKHEPYSGTNLRKRLITHFNMQSHMDMRYFVSLSQIYAIARPNPFKRKGRDGDFHIELEGDWVTMATIVEKGSMQMIAPSERKQGEPEEERRKREAEEAANPELRRFALEHGVVDNRTEGDKARPRSYRFMTLKLVDLGGSKGASDGKGTSGDAMMTLTVFEATSSHRSGNGERIYQGGSGGAFEKLALQQEGALIAMLNPKLRNVKSNTLQAAKRTAGNVMGLSISSAKDLWIVGYASDFARCEARKADGQPCSSFVDRRGGNDVCDFHLEKAVGKARNGRQEFANGNNTMGNPISSSSTFGAKLRNAAGMLSKGSQKPWQPPARYNALAPLEDMGGGGRSAQYVVESSGNVAPAWDASSRTFDVNARYGRKKEEAALRKRKREEQMGVVMKLEKRKLDKEGEGALPPPTWVRGEQDGEDTSSGIPAAHSMGAQAIFEAQRKMKEQREAEKAKQRAKEEKAAAKAAAKGKTKAIEGGTGSKPMSARAQRRAIFDSDSDSSTEAEDNGARAAQKTQPSVTASQAPSQQAKRWSYGAAAIKAMGFDPLAGARGGAAGGGASGATGSSQSRDRLLARLNAASSSLPEPKLELSKADRRKSSVVNPSRRGPGALTLVRQAPAERSVPAPAQPSSYSDDEEDLQLDFDFSTSKGKSTPPTSSQESVTAAGPLKTKSFLPPPAAAAEVDDDLDLIID